jgi:hypothetical protein
MEWDWIKFVGTEFRVTSCKNDDDYSRYFKRDEFREKL